MLKAFLPLLEDLPSASNMTDFASQFTKPEWDYLCRNHAFVDLIDHDLEKAKSVARALLGKTVI